jgi:hypothetical protein
MESEIDLSGILETIAERQDYLQEMRMTQEEREREQLVELAYKLYQPLLAEEPAYLDQIIDGLKKKRHAAMQKIGHAAKIGRTRRQLM